MANVYKGYLVRAEKRQRANGRKGITLIEVVLALVLIFALAVVWYPRKALAIPLQSKQINNCKQILL